MIEWARANVAAIIRGNHDKICVRDEPLDAYHPVGARFHRLDPRRVDAGEPRFS